MNMFFNVNKRLLCLAVVMSILVGCMTALTSFAAEQNGTLVFENLKLEKKQGDGSYLDTNVLSSGEIKVSIDAKVTDASSSSSTQMILAFYKMTDGIKLLQRCEITEPQTASTDSPAKLSKSIQIPEGNINNCKLGIFVWDSTSGLVSLYNTELLPFIDAYKTIEAEDFSGRNGDFTIAKTDAYTSLNGIDSGDYTYYKNIVFGDTGASSIETRLSGITTNGKIEIRLGSTDGQLIGTIKGVNTSEWSNYEAIKSNITKVTGTHDVYLLYTEGVSIDSFMFSDQAVAELPYYGAILEPDAGMIYTGAGQCDLTALMSMTNTASQNKKPIIMAVYNSMDSAMTEELYNAHIYFPGSILQIGYYLWDFDNILNGTYDSNIDLFADQLKELPHDVLLRIGYECDGPWNGYDATKYKAAFKRIVDRFRAKNVENVAFVWNISYPTLTMTNGNSMNYYPGDEYVDWWSFDFWVEEWHSNDHRAYYEEAKKHNKPVLIGESSKQYVAFSESFWDKYFGLVNYDPMMKGFQYINWYWESRGNSGWQWGDARYTNDQKWIDLYNNEMAKSKYIGLDASYFNTSGVAVQFGHNCAFPSNTDALMNQPWSKNKDIYTANEIEGYDYDSVENANYQFGWDRHTLSPIDKNKDLVVTFTVPEGKGGMVHYKDYNYSAKDVYFGDRKAVSNDWINGKFTYYASDVKDGKLIVRFKNTDPSKTMSLESIMVQRVSDTAPPAPTNVKVSSKGNNNTITWEDASNTGYYNVYRNGRPVATTTKKTYADNFKDAATYSVAAYDEKQGESFIAYQ